MSMPMVDDRLSSLRQERQVCAGQPGKLDQLGIGVELAGPAVALGFIGRTRKQRRICLRERIEPFGWQNVIDGPGVTLRAWSSTCFVLKQRPPKRSKRASMSTGSFSPSRNRSATRRRTEASCNCWLCALGIEHGIDRAFTRSALHLTLQRPPPSYGG
jgi:hypothetical protein